MVRIEIVFGEGGNQGSYLEFFFAMTTMTTLAAMIVAIRIVERIAMIQVFET